ncbi:MAG: hypothetical protein WB870_06655 [Gallionellaceae bacterium]
MKTDIPEVRQTPFTSYVDSAMGACVEDVHGRLLAAFGYHPDGTPATDEAERTCKALNNAEADRALIEQLVTALKAARMDMIQRAFVDDDAVTLVDAALAAAKERQP